MDYKYIEQLLERYWNCETTVEEENILRAFFAQNDLPVELEQYKDLFVYEQVLQDSAILGEDFDKRLLEKVGAEEKATPIVVKARRNSLFMHLRPLYQAAAAVAVVVLMGTGVQHAFNRPTEVTGWDYDATAYKDSYSSPSEAYETIDAEVLDGLKEALQAPGKEEVKDTVVLNTPEVR